MLVALVARLESLLFGHRRITLTALVLLTGLFAIAASKLHMEAGFEKQLPQGHEYIKTFEAFRDQVFGANRLTVVVHVKRGDIWTADALRTLHAVTEAVAAMPAVNRASVTSLWSSNVFFTEITEDGYSALPLTGGDILPDRLNPKLIEQIQSRTRLGGHIGTLVARDQTSAMVTAELVDKDPRTGAALDYLQLNRQIEDALRTPYEKGDFEIQIIGFAKQVGAIADSGAAVLRFFALAFALTAAAVWWYCRSVKLTVLPLVCSLASLVWQFGTLRLMGYGLDPLAILVPFLVFAIGVSHGVQQINFIVREVAGGADTATAARRSFTGLLVPGTLALLTAFVSFATLLLIPIPMIHELAVTAAIGVAYKIVTNLIMLPLAASYMSFSPAWAQKALAQREQRSRWLDFLAKATYPKQAILVTLAGIALFALAVWQSQGRIIGSLHAGAPELREDSRFNRDAASVVSKFDIGLDWLTVVFSSPGQKSCGKFALIDGVDRLGWTLRQTAGVVAVESAATLGKEAAAGLSEGLPRMAAIPRDERELAGVMIGLARSAGIRSSNCDMLALNVYLTDHKAETIKGVIETVKTFRSAHPIDGTEIRLASGNAGVQGATNEVLEATETPMMLYVFATILVLVFLAYRDWRAMLACCLPLAVGTWVGYWFMKDLEIGLTVATLPVMVLAVGIGVDYAFYIYNRLQVHAAGGLDVPAAMRLALKETGMATVFTAITLSAGVATWSFSELKFQADMGKLLAFMFMVNMVTALAFLPAFVAVLERIAPRRGPRHVPGFMDH